METVTNMQTPESVQASLALMIHIFQKTPEEIRQMFDELSAEYEGASISCNDFVLGKTPEEIRQKNIDMTNIQWEGASVECHEHILNKTPSETRD